MNAAHADNVSHRQEIYQTLLQKEAVKAESVRQAALMEAAKLPHDGSGASLPDNLGVAINVRV